MNNSKILLITSEFPPLPGGIGNHAFNLAKWLALEGCIVNVITDQRGEIAEESEFDAEHNLNVHRISITKPRALMYFKRIGKFLKLIAEHDIVIASGKFSLWLAAIGSVFYRRNYIAIIHGSEVNFKGFFLKKSVSASLRRFHKVIAVSNFTKSLIDDLNLRNVKVIPNGFDHQTFTVSNDQEVDLKGDLRLVTVGSVTERKGQLNVINMLPKLKETYANIHYHCIGIPIQENEFKNVAKQLDVNSNITFHGRKELSEMISILKQCDIFIMLSSITKEGDLEGFGIAILEANSLGLPAIGAKDCGIEDAIDPNKSGFLVSYDAAEEVKTAIESILESKAQFSKNAQEWAAKHQWNYIVKDYINYIFN